jgi:hypothetical protein
MIGMVIESHDRFLVKLLLDLLFQQVNPINQVCRLSYTIAHGNIVM